MSRCGVVGAGMGRFRRARAQVSARHTPASSNGPSSSTACSHLQGSHSQAAPQGAGRLLRPALCVLRKVIASRTMLHRSKCTVPYNTVLHCTARSAHSSGVPCPCPGVQLEVALVAQWPHSFLQLQQALRSTRVSERPGRGLGGRGRGWGRGREQGRG